MECRYNFARATRAILAIILCVGFAVSLLPNVAAAIDCPTRLLPRPAEDYEVTRARLEAAGQWQQTSDPARTPPPDPQLGDTWLWYVWDLGGMPVADLKPCTVRGMGDNCYVVVDDEEWLNGIDQDEVDRIVQHFENQSVGEFPDQGIWDLNTSHFGDPPNPLDGLDRIFLFYYQFNISADGFFWVFDQYPDGSMAWASNEADVVYLATDSGGGGPASDYMLAVAAHEFQHMIHFNQDSNEVAWVDEGLAELAMWLFGHPDNISSFNTNPDNSLLVWNGAWADYIKTYLWTLYFYEQYGGQPSIWNLIHNPANSLLGYQQTLDGEGYVTTTQDVCGDWVTANFLDDTTIPDGQFGYLGDDLPPFTAYRTHSVYPVSASGAVQHYAADYIRLQNVTAAPTITFNGADSRDFRLTLLAIDPDLPTLVQSVPLDDANDGSLTFGAAQGYAQVVMAIANVHASGTGLYNYEITLSPTAVLPTLSALPVLSNHPNPFNPQTAFEFTLPHDAAVRLTLHDARGREVARLVDGSLPTGPHNITWRAGSTPAGVYLGRLMVDGIDVSTVKVTIVK